MSKRLTIAQAQQQLPNLVQELTDGPDRDRSRWCSRYGGN